MKKNILIIFPMVYEAKPVFAKFAKGRKAKVGEMADISGEGSDSDIRALVSGFGCAASQNRIRLAVEKFRPDWVILAGYCGACRPGISAGDLLLDSSCGELPPELKSALGALDFKVGKIATTSGIAEADMKADLNASGYAGVELVASIVRETLKELGVRPVFSHMRWVSDASDCLMPMQFFADIMDFSCGEIKVSCAALVRSLLRNPREFVELCRYAKALSPVQKRYSEEIVRIVGALRG